MTGVAEQRHRAVAPHLQRLSIVQRPFVDRLDDVVEERSNRPCPPLELSPQVVRRPRLHPSVDVPGSLRDDAEEVVVALVTTDEIAHKVPIRSHSDRDLERQVGYRGAGAQVPDRPEPTH